jgi:hypothetical protein
MKNRIRFLPCIILRKRNNTLKEDTLAALHKTKGAGLKEKQGTTKEIIPSEISYFLRKKSLNAMRHNTVY